MERIIFIIVLIYLGALLGNFLSRTFKFTGFIRPKGLWNLVPFRVGGWRSVTSPNQVYVMKWAFGKLDFNKYWIKDTLRKR